MTYGVKREKSKTDYFMLIMGILFMLMASRKFPWEYVQRVATPLLRYVGLWRTPTFFAGLAYFFLTVNAAKAMGSLGEKTKTEEKAFEINELVKLIVIFICIGIYILQSSLMLK